MENSLKGLLLAAGIIITCIVVSLGFYIARGAKSTAQSGVSEINKLHAEFEESSKTVYDGAVVSGTEVLNALKKFKGERIGFLVDTKQAQASYNYHFSLETGALEDEIETDYMKLQVVGKSTYINPNASFRGSIYRNANGIITGIYFKQI